KVDSGVTSVSDARPLGAVRDSSGTTSSFVLDEVIVPAADLDAFVARYHGRVVGSDAVPVPPKELGLAVTDLAPTQYTVHVDGSAFDPSSFASDAARAGIKGEVAISSDAALKLLALVTREKANGVHVSPNFVGQASGLLSSTREHPTNNGFRDG